MRTEPFEVQPAKPVALFDWAQLERWDADPDQLPKDYHLSESAAEPVGPIQGLCDRRGPHHSCTDGTRNCSGLAEPPTPLAERSLQDSQKQYRLLADHMDDVLWVMNLETGQWDYCSPSMEKLVGYSVKEVTQRSFVHLMDDDVRRMCCNATRNAGKTKKHADASIPYTDTVPLNRSDGTKVWAESVTHYVRNEKAELTLIGVTRDVTSASLHSRKSISLPITTF